MTDIAKLKRITKWSTGDGYTLELNSGWPLVGAIDIMLHSLNNEEIERILNKINEIKIERSGAKQ